MKGRTSQRAGRKSYADRYAPAFGGYRQMDNRNAAGGPLISERAIRRSTEPGGGTGPAKRKLSKEEAKARYDASVAGRPAPAWVTLPKATQRKWRDPEFKG